ncbi:MAG: hypothetical protein COB20_06435 [SAR86 cluster bacterium]|uniref:Uncharacterized protein n=1 Tax=SAR86 cluster bacterium TaxID=2030880 RepID=A0A2A4X9B8_9GAMM|nr:MAG: hypothetical protein COB20_06435 [SAR86 cluster bacterium]
MSELNWQDLRVGMLKNGVAPKYARRTILELKSHFAELESRAIDEGLSEIAAQKRARKEIGDEATILNEVLSKPELRSIPSKFPRTFFLVTPTLSLLFTFGITLLLLLMSYESGNAIESGNELAAWQKLPVQAWFLASCYLLVPCYALVTIAIAKERFINPFWPAAGIVIMVFLGSSWAYTLDWPTAESAGAFSMNWGYSYFPRALRGDHDLQNYLQIVVTLTAAVVFWRMYDPLRRKLIN